MLIRDPTKMSGRERNHVCVTEPQKPNRSISAGMKSCKGIWIMEEGWIQENNDLACNSLEESNTFIRKCKTSDAGTVCC